MKTKLFLYFTLLVSAHLFSQTSTPNIIPKLSTESHITIDSRIKAGKIKNETFQVETDKFGRVLSVKGNSDKLKILFYRLNFVPYIDAENNLIPITYTLTIKDEKIKDIYILNNKKDTIYTQLNNAVLLAFLMSEKEYSQAINLFSKKQREDINKMKSNETYFSYWTNSWTFNDAKLDRYTKRIILGRGNFIFEDFDWKIDEK